MEAKINYVKALSDDVVNSARRMRMETDNIFQKMLDELERDEEELGNKIRLLMMDLMLGVEDKEDEQ